MSVIIRLQGLPWSASALDIRNFFRGLIIPQGGVHIIGGERGDAFIAFSSDEDARQAMMRNTACLNGVSVQLFLSSKSEMQAVIDEARNRNTPSVAVAPTQMMAPVSSGGMGPQNQPYPVPPDMSNQRLPQQANYPKAPDPNQGQFPGMQNAERSHNPMQNQGPQIPDRGNQFGFQDPYQQNLPTGKPNTDPWAQNYEGFPSDANLGKENQQNQWNTRGSNARMEGGYEGQDSNQWYQEGPEFGAKQPFYGGNQLPQGHGPGHQRDHPPDQYNSSGAGQELQFPQQQRREQPYTAESFWQEEYGTGNRDSFPRMAEQPGPQDMNRAGILPRPGQGSEPAGMLNAEHMPSRPGPDDHMRFPGMGRSNMEQMPDMKKGQGRGRGHPGEGYEPQTPEGYRFPPNRGEGPPARGGVRQGMFPDGPPKRGILPTPDVANQDPQRDHNSEQLYNPEDVEQVQWPDRGGEESRGHEHGRGRGQFPPGREPDASMGRGRPFDGPEKRRPHDRPRRSRFDQPDERSVEGSDGRPLERGFGGRPADAYHDERSVERGPDRRPLPEREHALERGSDGRPPRRGHDGPPHDEWPGLERKNQSRTFGGEPDGRPFDRAPGKRPLERVPGGPPADRDPFGMALDRNENREPSERRPFKRGPDGRPKEGGLLGRAPDRRPLPGGPEGQAGGQLDESFHKGRPEPGRHFEGPHGRFDGPPGNRFPPNEGFEPMDIEFNPEGHGDPGARGPRGRGLPGARDFEERGRERGDRTGRGRSHDRRDEGRRGSRGMNRGNDYERGRGRRPFNQPGEFDEYPGKERYEDGRFEDVTTEERHRDHFSHQRLGGGDMEPGQRFGRVEGGPRRPGRPGRSHGRPDDSQDTTMDRRHMGRGRENMDGNMRDGYRELPPEEVRVGGKGLLGDAPGGLLPTPPVIRPQDSSHLVQHRSDDFQRDRDRRSHMSREDRDAGRDDRPSRRTDHRQIHDRSPSREHVQRRNERDRDRSEHRDRSSNRDSKDVGHKGGEKSGKNDKKPDEQMKQMSESKFIHAKGFPVAYTDSEIQRFFFGCDLLFTGIRILKNARGQNTGEVCLEFPTVDHAKKAITKNGETIFGTPITLTFTTKRDFDEKTKSSPSSTEKEKTSSTSSPQKDSKGTHIVKIKGLPPNIKREDLVNFFSSVKLATVGKPVAMEYDEKKQATGTAYIMTASLKDFETAMGYNGHILGSKALQLCAGEQKEMDACIAKQEEIGNKGEGSSVQPEKPPAGPGVMGARPPLMGVAPPGRPPLFSQKPPMNMTSDTPRNGPVLDPGKTFPRPQPGERLPRNQGPGFCVQIQGLPMLATYNDIRGFFAGLNIATHRGVQIVHDGNGRPTGEGFVEFVTQEDKDQALKKDKTSLGSQIVAVKSVAKPDMIERLRNARLSSVAPAQDLPNPSHFPPRRPDGPASFVNIPPRLLNPRWFYISCQNFPQGIAVPDIVDFFQDYNPIPESIRQLYADDGTSTGNAVVGFFGREDAELALEDLNGMLFGQSMVILQPIKSKG